MTHRSPVLVTAICVFLLLLSFSRFGLAKKFPRKRAGGLFLHEVSLAAVEPSSKKRPRRRLGEDKDKDTNSFPTRRPTTQPSRRPTTQPSREPQLTPIPTPTPGPSSGRPSGTNEPTPLPTIPSPSPPPFTNPTLPQPPEKDVTSPPSPAPTVVTSPPPPAPAAVTSPPSPAPTAVTSPPSPAPTASKADPQSPAEASFEIKGEIFLHFSLKRPTLVEGADVMPEREAELSQAVVNALLFILCVETDFVVGSNDTIGGASICSSFRNLLEDEESKSTISGDAVIQIKDVKAGELEWIEWTIAFPVLNVGDNYRQSALQLLKDDATDDAVNEVALELMRETAREALSSNIQNNRFDELIGNKVQTSLVGQETETFGGNAALEGEPTPVEPLEPSAFHTLRVVGIGLLLLIIVMGFLVSKLASRQRKRLDLEALDETSEGGGGGGLHKDESLDLMSDLARKRDGSAHMQVSPALSDDIDRDVTDELVSQKAGSSDIYPKASLSPVEPFCYDSREGHTECQSERIPSLSHPDCQSLHPRGENMNRSNYGESSFLVLHNPSPSPELASPSSPTAKAIPSLDSDNSNGEFGGFGHFSTSCLPECLKSKRSDHTKQDDDHRLIVRPRLEHL